MHLIEYFVRNPVKVAVGVLLVLLYGLVAVLTMPMQLMMTSGSVSVTARATVDMSRASTWPTARDSPR